MRTTHNLSDQSITSAKRKRETEDMLVCVTCNDGNQCTTGAGTKRKYGDLQVCVTSNQSNQSKTDMKGKEYVGVTHNKRMLIKEYPVQKKKSWKGDMGECDA